MSSRSDLQPIQRPPRRPVASRRVRRARPVVAVAALLATWVVLGALGYAAGIALRPQGLLAGLNRFDFRVRHDVILFGHQPDFALHAINLLGDSAVVIVGAIVAAILIIRNERRPALAAVPVASLLGAGLFIVTLKPLVDRPNPGARLAADPPSFPSGHAAGITALAVSVAAVLWITRRSWWPMLVAILAIGVIGAVLILIQAHWFSDVAFGIVLGGWWAFAVVAVAVALEPAYDRSTGTAALRPPSPPARSSGGAASAR